MIQEYIYIFLDDYFINCNAISRIFVSISVFEPSSIRWGKKVE